MSSQQTIGRRQTRSRAAWLLLFVLAWTLGQALALEHRVAHGATGAPHAAHGLGGEHHDDDPQCRLIDQAGWADAAPLPPAAPAAAPACDAVAAAIAPGAVAHTRGRPYEARAPPAD